MEGMERLKGSGEGRKGRGPKPNLSKGPKYRVTPLYTQGWALESTALQRKVKIIS